MLHFFYERMCAMNINLDFNYIINQIASALGVAKDVVIEMYPHLLREYTCFKFFDLLFLCLVISSIAATIFAFSMVFISFDYYSDISKKTVVLMVISTIVMWVLTIAVYGAKLFTSPNIHLLLDLINR